MICKIVYWERDGAMDFLGIASGVMVIAALFFCYRIWVTYRSQTIALDPKMRKIDSMIMDLSLTLMDDQSKVGTRQKEVEALEQKVSDRKQRRDQLQQLFEDEGKQAKGTEGKDKTMEDRRTPLF